MMPLITSASTCWAAKPTMATSREELVKRVALRAFVVVNRPLIQIHAVMDNKTFDMLLKNLMWICSLRFRIIPNILLMANIPALHRPPMTAILMRSISIQTSFPFMTACLSVYHKHRKLTILAFFQLSSIFFRIFTVLIQFVPLNSGRNIIYSMNCIRAKLPIMIPAVHTIHARLPCRVQPLHTGFMPDPEGFLILSGKLLVTSRLRPLLSCPEGLRLQPAPI